MKPQTLSSSVLLHSLPNSYDPTNGDYVSFETEDEICRWIEQRYYTRDRD